MLVREHAHFDTFIATLMIKPIPAGGGVVSLTPPWRFLEITQKVLV